jgi:predicted dehydrogenase
MKSKSRREFLKLAGAAGAGLAMIPQISKAGTGQKKELNIVNIAFIGVGRRGRNLLAEAVKLKGINISAICDIDPEAIKKAEQLLVKSGRVIPPFYTEGEFAFEKMVERDDIDGVIIATPWLWHTKMAVTTMKAGKYVAVEVSAANTMEECWDLVNTSEETGMPCMILENANFNREVMAVMNMARKNVFGEIVHARCGYLHNLLGIKFNNGLQFGEGAISEARWRTQHSLKRNGDIYPTHGVGPVAAMLDINRGNRFLYVTSTASKAVGIKDYIREQGGDDHPYASLDWKLGDIITSTIKTSNGESIIITHDCNLPRPKGSDFRLQGTDGLIEMDPHMQRIHIEGVTGPHKWDTCEKYIKEYDHSLWKNHGTAAEGSRHGGDFFVVREFVNSVKEQRQPVLDVYDAATWSALTPLSEASIAMGSAPQYFPDFTRGNWINRKPMEFT